MSSAEIYVGSKSDDGSAVLSKRFSSGYEEPTLVKEKFGVYLIKNNTGTFGDIFKITFLRPMQPRSSREIDLTLGKTSLIWAFHQDKIPSPLGEITIHTSKNSVIDCDLFSSSSFKKNDGKDNDGKVDSQKNKSPFMDNNSLIKLHGSMMFLGWCVFAPAGILVARFFKVIF
ncbi:hypothetical protein HK099_002629 [Clydaea vesicula]|uniref:DOMON domain-containing protein n=1 Tax=Clydaea vesicula TaxID=447962 RepID=A0AAD5XRX4_9FUNG|nr:hypothetical protein HK099_002629 [Clydaea vesicula]